MIEKETLFALTTCCIVPGMVDTIRTYGHDGSVGCSNKDTVDPSECELNTCQLVLDVGCNANEAYSDFIA